MCSGKIYSEVLGGDLVQGTELPESTRLLLSSAVLERERVSPEDLPDSGCTGLLEDEDEEDNCSLQRATSSTAGEHIVGGGRCSTATTGVSGSGGGASCGDRDSGGGSVASSCGVGGSAGGSQQRSPTTDQNSKETVYAQLQKRKSVNGHGELPALPVYPHQFPKHLLQHPQIPLLHVDGPLDGSPYAIVNPLVKHKALADSGISVSLIEFILFLVLFIVVMGAINQTSQSVYILSFLKDTTIIIICKLSVVHMQCGIRS